MGEFVYVVSGENFGFTPEIIDAAYAESVALFDAAPGSRLELDLSFDEDGGKTGKVVLGIDRPARREDWDRGSFTVLEADLSFEPAIGDIVGRTGSIDAAIDFRPGTDHPIGLGKVAHVSIGRSLVINFDIPDQPELVNRWMPFVLDCRLVPPQTE